MVGKMFLSAVLQQYADDNCHVAYYAYYNALHFAAVSLPMHAHLPGACCNYARGACSMYKRLLCNRQLQQLVCKARQAMTSEASNCHHLVMALTQAVTHSFFTSISLLERAHLL